MSRWKSPWQTRQTETVPVKTFNAPLLFSVFCARLVAVLVKSREVSQGQGVWREWHFGISIVHYVQARGPKECT